MNPDDFKQAWQSQTSQTRLAVDTDRLLDEVRRGQEKFASMIYWRDLGEVATAVIMIPVWIGMGIAISLPWTWYLTLPVLLWIAGYMFVDLRRHRRQRTGPGESLRQSLETALVQVNHQIWLLRNVVWWYLLPLYLSLTIFIGHVVWQIRFAGWAAAAFFGVLVGFITILYYFIYRLNQTAVRTTLEPRRQELTTLLASLSDDAGTA